MALSTARRRAPRTCVPSGEITSLRPPRLRERHRHADSQGATVVADAGSVIRPPSARPCRRADRRPGSQSIDAQPQVSAVRADVDALDEQLDDARLLGGEQLVPQRIEPLQRLAHLGLG